MKHATAMKQVHDPISKYISFKLVQSSFPNSTLFILSKTTFFFLDSTYNILNEQLQLQLLLNKQVICKLQNFTNHYDFGHILSSLIPKSTGILLAFSRLLLHSLATQTPGKTKTKRILLNGTLTNLHKKFPLSLQGSFPGPGQAMA